MLLGLALGLVPAWSALAPSNRGIGDQHGEDFRSEAARYLNPSPAPDSRDCPRFLQHSGDPQLTTLTAYCNSRSGRVASREPDSWLEVGRAMRVQNGRSDVTKHSRAAAAAPSPSNARQPGHGPSQALKDHGQQGDAKLDFSHRHPGDEEEMLHHRPRAFHQRHMRMNKSRNYHRRLGARTADMMLCRLLHSSGISTSSGRTCTQSGLSSTRTNCSRDFANRRTRRHTCSQRR